MSDRTYTLFVSLVLLALGYFLAAHCLTRLNAQDTRLDLLEAHIGVACEHYPAQGVPQ